MATEPRGADLLTVVGALLGAQAGREPAADRPVDLASAVRPAVRGVVLHHRAAGHDPGHPALPRLRADQGHRAGDGRADRRPLRRRHPARSSRRSRERLVEVPGLGPKRTTMIAAAWEEQKAIKEVMVFLQGVGVSTSLAVRIYKQYGDASIAVVRERAVPAGRRRVGHRVQDRRHHRPGRRHPARQPGAGQGRAAATPCREAADDGHCYLPAPNLVADAVEDPRRARRPGRRAAWTSWSPRRAWSARTCPAGGRHACPRSTWCRSTAPSSPWPAALLTPAAHRRATGWPHFAGVDWDKALAWLTARTGADLAPEQEQAVRLALTEKVAVLTGGPGCGKSFTVRSIVELAARQEGQDRCWPRRPAGPPSASPS